MLNVNNNFVIIVEKFFIVFFCFVNFWYKNLVFIVLSI